MSILGDTMICVSDIMSTSGVFSTLDRYHECNGECPIH